MPGNRGCRDELRTYPTEEVWGGIKFRRVWRPRLRQATPIGRILNAGFIIAAWSCAALKRPVPDAIVIGTDPILGVSVAIPWKLLHPKVKVAHWCFDLYPEAAIQGGLIRSSGIAGLLKNLAGAAYRRCDLLADIGTCMRRQLSKYAPACKKATLVPWALSEPSTVLPADREERATLFGDAQLALMYSGNFGRAHSCDTLFALARAMRGHSARFVFSIRGNRADDVTGNIRPEDTNVRVAPFTSLEHLTTRLSAPDIHIVTLREEWTGTVVPSKFFGALAAGRPVLFAGSRHCAIARWIEEFGVGWVLTPENIAGIVGELVSVSTDRGRLKALFQRCHATYQAQFAREVTLDKWDQNLRTLVSTTQRLRVLSGLLKRGPSQSRRPS